MEDKIHIMSWKIPLAVIAVKPVTQNKVKSTDLSCQEEIKKRSSFLIRKAPNYIQIHKSMASHPKVNREPATYQ